MPSSKAMPWPDADAADENGEMAMGNGDKIAEENGVEAVGDNDDVAVRVNDDVVGPNKELVVCRSGSWKVSFPALKAALNSSRLMEPVMGFALGKPLVACSWYTSSPAGFISAWELPANGPSGRC